MISPSEPGQPEFSSVGSPPGGHAREVSVNHWVFGLPGGTASNPDVKVTSSGVTHCERLRISDPLLKRPWMEWLDVGNHNEHAPTRPRMHGVGFVR
jgi:hypothetical protein